MIHVIGDSHVMVFSGKEYVPDTVDDRGFLPPFTTYRLGPFTAYNIANKRSLIETVITQNVKAGDSVMFCFGEIDCRAHLIRQSEIQQRPLEDVVRECVARYSALFDVQDKYGVRTLIWNVPASSREDVASGEFSTYGTCEQRNRVTRIFNTMLGEVCEERHLPFVSIFESLVDEDDLTNSEYYADAIHLSQKAMPLILDELRKQGLLERPLETERFPREREQSHRLEIERGDRYSAGEKDRVLVCCGIRDIARIIAFRPHYDFCLLIDADRSLPNTRKRFSEMTRVWLFCRSPW